MLFVTNRHPTGSKRFRANRPISFDLKNPEPTAHCFYCRREPNGKFVEVGQAALFSQLQQQERKHILLFIHGFNVKMPNALQGADDLQRACDILYPGQVLVVPFIWPSMGGILEYWDDQDSAEASAKSFARAMQKFMSWRTAQEEERLNYERLDDAEKAKKPKPEICDRRISLLAHSMGNRVLRYTLDQVQRNTGSMPFMFRNVFMVAADIVNQSLEKGEAGRLISDAARNVIVYHAADDLALRTSKAANVANRIVSRRLGHSGPEDMAAVARRVFAVDCCAFNNQYDDPMGHSYYVQDSFRTGDSEDPGGVMRHMVHALATGSVDIPFTTGQIDPREFAEPRAFQMGVKYRAPLYPGGPA